MKEEKEKVHCDDNDDDTYSFTRVTVENERMKVMVGLHTVTQSWNRLHAFCPRHTRRDPLCEASLTSRRIR